ncbi:TPA: hypothetical protein PXJ50_004580 [Yersinia enterocolitica]|uniref:hypothetical protein n=1 Tax=Yersinia enterocolitica TaxID=630 RepID=UPI0028D99F60|nr:hypothetical protein [Yersinia enterocolitica]HDL6671079.1 hypothetical protein [Yersinia enterocolitica]HDL6691329.1 hypothetical protein [Yersinia enterocolitica]HDL6736051.1 hypothetical protein [Yersinia enterocolitica]HDL6766295.1 hypothetical protein [Yersinia enterocolitica]
MKELDGFTVEQLNDFIKSDHTQCGDVAALARIALAAKRAEPIYQYQSGVCMFDDIEWVWDDCDKGFYVQYDPTRRRIVYTTPQLNSPEIPEGWISIPRDMLADYRDVKNAEVENYKAGFAGYYNREGTRWARDFADLCEELAAIDKVLAAAPEKPL